MGGVLGAVPTDAPVRGEEGLWAEREMTSCVTLELGWLFRGAPHGGWGLGLCSSLGELWLQAPWGDT